MDRYNDAVIQVGSRIRGWTVTTPLGASPSGWRDLLAEDAAGGCVVMRVPPDLDGVASIREEADLAMKHAHESLVQSVGLVEHEGWPVQILEHIDGLTIEELTALTGPLPPAAVCRIGRQIALALVELHERAPVLCHGSLGPDRVIIDDGGNARLLDVGIARPTSKPRSLSPERRRHWTKPDAADDLWALGMLLADAALGEARVIDDRLDVTSALAKLSLPERLADALTVLVAPAGSRVKNATAVVRIFTELELRLSTEGEGDGSSTLRAAMRWARTLARPTPTSGVSDDGVTIPSSTESAPASPASAPASSASAPFRNAHEGPRTIVMGGDGIDLAELRRMSAIAQEAFARRPRDDVRTVPLMVAKPLAPSEPPMEAPSAHTAPVALMTSTTTLAAVAERPDPVTMPIPSADVPSFAGEPARAPERAPVAPLDPAATRVAPVPRGHAPTVRLDRSARDVDELLPEERAAVGGRASKKVALVLGAAAVTVGIVLAWLT